MLLAGYLAEVEASVHTFAWLARLPSKNNVADQTRRHEMT